MLSIAHILEIEKISRLDQLAALTVDLQNCYFSGDTKMDFTMAEIGFDMDNAPDVAARHPAYFERLLNVLYPSQVALTMMEENRATWGRYFTTPEPHPAPLGKGRIDPIGLFGTPSGELALPDATRRMLLDAGVLMIDKYGICPGEHNPKYIQFLGVNHAATHIILTGGLTSRGLARVGKDLRAKGRSLIILEDLVAMPSRHPRPDIDLASERDAQIAAWQADEKIVYCQSGDLLAHLEQKFRSARAEASAAPVREPA